jgi:K+-sensing histidine kinase KdpD
MSDHKDKSTVFLQVMAHDLLAPLTAIKWQTELLHKNVKDKKKREDYLSGIASSTELGISIAKNTHVASKVLSDAYDGLVEEGNVSEHVQKAVTDLVLQFERHGLVLQNEIEETETLSQTDIPLLELYVWSLAKFYLTITPPNNTVIAKGAKKDNGYELILSAPNVPDKEKQIEDFQNGEAQEVFDQKFVFIELIKKIAPQINTQPELKAEGDNLLIVSVFS